MLSYECYVIIIIRIIIFLTITFQQIEGIKFWKTLHKHQS